MIKMSKKMCIYVRVSTNDGRQNTDRQIEELQEYLLKNGASKDNIEVYSEMVSGLSKLKDRPILENLIEKMKMNPSEYDTLCISEVSRLGRDPISTRRVIEDLAALKINVYIGSLRKNTLENGSLSAYTTILLTVLTEFAYMEAAQIKMRSRSGLLSAARKGHMGGGIYYTYGYKKDENKLMVIDEEEAAVVRQIFDLYKNEGYGIKVISNFLNEKKIPTRLHKSYPDKKFNLGIEKRGRDIKWSDKQVHSILKNTTYIGKRKFAGHIVNCPQIIDGETFEYCNEQLKQKAVKGDSTYTYLLKNKIKCGYCGANFYGRYKPGIKGEKVYKCSSSRHKDQNCGIRGVNINLIESVIIQFTNIIISLIHEFNQIESTTVNIQKEIDSLKLLIALRENEIKEQTKMNERLIDLFIGGGITQAEFDNKRDTIQKEINKAEKAMKPLKSELQRYNKQLGSTPVIPFLKKEHSRRYLQKILASTYELILIKDVVDDQVALKVLVPLRGKNMLEAHLVLFQKEYRKSKTPLYSITFLKIAKRYDGDLSLNFRSKNLIQDRFAEVNSADGYEGDLLFNLRQKDLISQDRSEEYISYSIPDIQQINKALAEGSVMEGEEKDKQIIDRFYSISSYDFHKSFKIDESQQFEIKPN